jgi:hypothetical protein
LGWAAALLLAAATPVSAAATDTELLDLPLQDLLQVEIRSAGKREQLRDIPASVTLLTRNDIARNGPRVSASAGSRDSGRLFARLGRETDDGFFVLSAGGYRTDGLEAAYGNMMSAEQLGRLDPRMHRSLDGDVDRRNLSLSLSARWRDVFADLRCTETRYGFYLATPSFDPGSGLFAELHASNLLNTQIRYPAIAPVDFERGLIGPGRTLTATLGRAF